jgi:hypothetical protein
LLNKSTNIHGHYWPLNLKMSFGGGYIEGQHYFFEGDKGIDGKVPGGRGRGREDNLPKPKSTYRGQLRLSMTGPWFLV